MQNELTDEYPELNINLLGVNAAGLESGLDSMSDGRDLPLLQDIPAVGAWDLWEATWRDVFILDEDNAVYAVYNLTENDLADPDNYAELKAMLIAAVD